MAKKLTDSEEPIVVTTDPNEMPEASIEKSGFEGTGEKDPLKDNDDEGIKPITKVAAVAPEKVEEPVKTESVKVEPVKTEEKKEDPAPTVEDEEPETFVKPISRDLTPKVEEKIEEPAIEEDVFSREPVEKIEETPKVEDDKFDFEVFEKEFDIKLEGEAKTKDNVFKELKTKLETAKQVVELDITKYDSQTQQVFKALQNGKTLVDVIEPLQKFNDFLILPEEDIAAAGLISNGEKEEAVEGIIEQMKEDGKLETFVTEVKESVIKAKGEVLDNIVKESEAAAIEKQTIEVKNREVENNNILESINKIDKFMGLDLPQSAKDDLIKEVKSGQFHKEINNSETVVKARLYTLYADKIISKLNTDIDKAKKEGYASGFAKGKGELHNIPPSLGGARNGMQQGAYQVDSSNLKKPKIEENSD
jgi:hypothetical protein